MEMMLNVAESDSGSYTSDESGDEESEYSKQISKQNAADNIAGLPYTNEEISIMNDIQGLVKKKVEDDYKYAKRREFNMNPIGYNSGNQQAKVIEFNLDDI